MEVAESVLRAGYRLDRYELLCPIASGGMATVWLARLRGKRGFEKLFAVKTIRTELVEDPQFEEMLLDEARIASGIQHANVAQILDLGEQDDVLFIVMEWVDGDSLAKIRKILAKRDARVPVGVVLRLLADVCAGLHAAHELRNDNGEPLEIVHRDVSPHNILVAQSGAAKVIDFGIAKAQNRRQGETRTGVVKGKIQYMAPEQVKKGGIVDRRADVWALGVCLHELVAGKMPYGGEDDVGVIRKLMNDEAPAVDAGLPPPIARVLEQAIAVEPDARFPSAAGMQRALEGAMKELGEAVSSEDVAWFLRTELPDLARKRKEAITKAVAEARDRAGADGPPGDEVAFAPTVVGDRNRDAIARDEARAIALIKRKGAPPSDPASSDEPADSPGDSHLTPWAALEQEPVTIPKRSRGWLWALALLVGGVAAAGMAWPAAATRVMTTLGWRDPPPAAVTIDTQGRGPPQPAGELPTPAPTTVPQASPTRTIDAAAPSVIAKPVDVAFQPTPNTRAAGAVVTPVAAPSETVALPIIAQDASAPAGPIGEPEGTPSPPPPEEDPNNPYNN